MPIASAAGDVEAIIRYEYMPDVSVTSLLTALNGSATALDRTNWVFSPESVQSSNPPTLALDGDTGNFWENRWGSSGYGPYELAVQRRSRLRFETESEHSGALASSGRLCDRHQDDRGLRCRNGRLQQQGVDPIRRPHLGTCEFGNTSNRNQAQLFALDPAETQYLIMRFTGTNRGNCASLAEIGFGQRQPRPNNTLRGDCPRLVDVADSSTSQQPSSLRTQCNARRRLICGHFYFSPHELRSQGGVRFE